MAGTRFIQLGALAQALTQRFQQSMASNKPSIGSIKPSDWPNPMQPVKPFGQPGSEPLRFPFFEGQNLTYTPRFDDEYAATDLRALATYPLARICIENVKDIVCQTEWSIGLKPIPGETQRERAARQKGDDNIVNLSRFFEYPDRELEWPIWSRGLMENMLVIDAATLLAERSRRGKVAALKSLDGAGITRYINERGETPAPPDVAYSQLWFGLPRMDFTTDEVLYGVRNIVPRNTISSYLYGFSPTQALATEIKVGIERLGFVLSYYTSGSVPDVIQIAPPGVTPKQVQETIMANNAILSGNLQRRRQWNVLQGFQRDGKQDQIIFPKEPLLADPFDEMHIRKICYGYGDSPQRLLKSMNRSSSESSQTAAEEEGITPWVIWLEGIINRVIQKYMGMVDYEITFKQERESDILKIMQTDVGYVKNGGYTWNERRELRGDDPRPEPEADQLGVITANGWMEIGTVYQDTPPVDHPDHQDDSSPSPANHSGEKVRMITRT